MQRRALSTLGFDGMEKEDLCASSHCVSIFVHFLDITLKHEKYKKWRYSPKNSGNLNFPALLIFNGKLKCLKLLKSVENSNWIFQSAKKGGKIQIP